MTTTQTTPRQLDTLATENCPGCGRDIPKSANPDWLTASHWCRDCGGSAIPIRRNRCV